MTSNVNISVRSLVEYVYRSGSIESGFRTSRALTEGTKAHQKVQKQYGESDQHEVYVSAEIPYEDLLFVIDGRCDGLLLDADGVSVTVDEIKSTSSDIGQIEEDSYPVHWAQAKCYAYMVAKDRGLSRMRIQLTYMQVDTEETRRFVVEVSSDELERFMLDVVERYYPYAQARCEHELRRNQSIKELSFPFPNYREGQRKLAGAVYKTINEGRKLFAKAPTGIGKTMSTLFPSVKAIGEGLLQRIFYLTARTTTRTAAEEAYSLLHAGGLQLHVVTITAKEKVCFKEEVRCSKEHCEFADGYYDRVNEAVLDLLRHETIMTRTVIESYARKHRVCPFEFSLDVAYAADAVICDYNYIFDPRVNLKRLFEEQKRQTSLLVDEAHNLVDRAREMYSSSLNKSDFLALQREFKGARAELHDAAKAINQYFIAMRKQIGDRQMQVEPELPEALIGLLDVFIAAAEKELAGARGLASPGTLQGAETEPATAAPPAAPLLLEAYFGAQNFVRIAKLYDERYVTFMECDRNEVSVKLFCLDPSHLLRQMGKGYRSHVFFSATLSPLSYFMDTLGAGEDDYSVTVPSPFSKEQLDVFVQPLSTRYQDRERSREPIARSLYELLAKRSGNYLVFFPSYAYMSSVYEAFTDLVGEQEALHPEQPELRVLVQQTQMSEEEREHFLAEFQAGTEKTHVGFAVMGGIFSEGIDLVGDRLTGVAVVGVGLPQLGPERNLIKAYMDRTGKNGYEYAYVFPGMNKVQQAGGRLIRSETDRGVLLLIDDRYFQPLYQRLLPEEWRGYTVLQAQRR
ncbi:ATP-dependent DNA helicase [Paenibacillus alginolyticus]|uniref:ATP-dependent DNA helicase n=1 Tax=Paenibacillus alginolyticus TaxID=59839 RepID=A0ABT4GCG8_9BACL|nr:ATP-dependent DNA helicase [Paenibacillus alginolyticus]MCY9693885.1 ATP-dependent DNA helicase [Paenibacillus alginolyticus]MEC0145137.1 ATP-dependent DNA helicase [Paenibacillus alginolyticus]